METITYINEMTAFKYKIERASIYQDVEFRENVLIINISVDSIIGALNQVLFDGIEINRIKINFPDSVELTEKFEYATVAKSKGWFIQLKDKK